MNLKSGHYFSAMDAGVLIWGGIEQGDGEAAMRRMLAGHYDAPAAELDAALALFLGQLLEHGLITAQGEAAARPEAFAPPPGRMKFVPPVLEVHTDMGDMLLIDPIDDVDEVGWPTAPPRRMPRPGAPG